MTEPRVRRRTWVDPSMKTGPARGVFLWRLSVTGLEGPACGHRVSNSVVSEEAEMSTEKQKRAARENIKRLSALTARNHAATHKA